MITAVNCIGTSHQSNAASTTTLAIPSAPQNLQATGIGSVALVWQAPSSDGGSAITNYKIYRSSSSGTEGLLTTVGNVTSYTDTALASDHTYFYKVTAVNSIGTSRQSDEASTIAPTNLVATAGNARIALSWSAPSTNGGSVITNYKVYRGTSSNTETFLAQIGNSTSYTDTAVINGQTYYYKVSAVNSIRESPQSNEASAILSTIPSAPQNLQATAGVGSVTLSWQAPSNGGSPITGYKIYRSSSSGTEGLLTTVGNVTSYTDTGLASDHIYFYKVTAVNRIGTSLQSNEASTSAPTNLLAVASSGQIALSWNAPSTNGGSAITNYKVYRGTSSNTETFLAQIGNSTSYTDTTVTPGQAYFYKVSAVNSIRESILSNEASATTFSIPSAPQNLQATAGIGNVTLSWQAPSSNGGSSITAYKIYRSSSSGTEGLLTTVGKVTSYTDTGLTSGHTYFYKITAVNGIGTSSQSNEASTTTLSI